MRILTRRSRQILLGSLPIGGGAPVSVQSMTKTDTRDVESTLLEAKRLEAAGCDVIRMAVPDTEAAQRLPVYKHALKVPLVADIHFDHRLAMLSLEAGVDGLRINPGNIGARWKVKELVESAKERNVPIRIGVNAGSLEKEVYERYGIPCPRALVESALRHVRILEELNYLNMKVSLKTSEVTNTIEAYEIFSQLRDYPLHLGITEAGAGTRGVVKSSVGISLLLARGIGDTIRISLTGDPVKEVEAGVEILKTLGLKEKGIEIVSCPSCGRCKWDILRMVQEAQERLSLVKAPLKIAIMGCEVNGPGEAREADIGLVGGDGVALLFARGRIVGKVNMENALDVLMELVKDRIRREVDSENKEGVVCN
jgi:(E)-4-hydroxy-3-methylbut-2-enyl-diphosphate synthase